MSASSRWSGSRSNGATCPPNFSASDCARSAWRFVTNIVVTPRSDSARAVSSLVSPAPMMTTWRSERSPSFSSASPTATDETDACPSEIFVSVRTRLPVCSAAVNRRFVSGPVVPAASAVSYARLTWPWTSTSPTIIDSNPLVTRNSWRAASQLRGA